MTLKAESGFTWVNLKSLSLQLQQTYKIISNNFMQAPEYLNDATQNQGTNFSYTKQIM